MSEVRLDRVRKVYDNGHVAVKGASFEARAGELLVLVGPSGCGKSTLLRIIAGLEAPSDGTLSIGGRIVNDVPPKDRDVAMVFQSYALYPHMSVAENLGFGLKLRKLSAAEIGERVRAAAEKLGLTKVLSHRPGMLSGGQRQRVALGRAIVRNPRVFLLDEPLSNLDAKLRLSTRIQIARLQRSLKATMIYVTHDQVEAMTLGQRIVVLNAGEIQQIDTPMRLYGHPANLFVAGFFGNPAMNFFRGVLGRDGHIRLNGGGVAMPVGNLTDTNPLMRDYAEREVVIGLRPEDMRPVAGSGDGPAAEEPGGRESGRAGERMNPGRRESGRAGGQKSSATTISARLEYVEPVGNEIFLNLRFGGCDLVSRVPPMPLPEPGGTIELAFQPTALHCFDAESGLRIGA
jgi:multiple sugar transport system ATP-binding protein